MPDLDAWGIQGGYHDITGAWRQASPRTIEAITAAMGVASDQPPPGPAVWIVRAGDGIALGGRWQLVNDDTHESSLVSGSVRDLAPGYYRAYHDDGRGLRLIVTPGRCWLPDDLRTWGWAVQLYALRSRASWGIGDLADLRDFCGLAGAPERGSAGFVLLNPLHAAAPVVPQQPSPYYPSSRCFRNPLYLRVEDVPGVAHVLDDVDALAAAGRRLNDDRRIDRDAVFRAKTDALTRVFAAVPVDDVEFDRFVIDGGELLARYATHCTLAETYGGDWRNWPAHYRDPSSFESRQVREQQYARVRFHQWLQWLLDGQLRTASTCGVSVMQDVAIGVDPGGADAWMWQAVLAPGMTVGAPPDEYNSQGQDWGLPPFDPWKLRDAEYEPFIQTVRAVFRHAGGLRFDHVMGLFRLFWIPAGGTARDGTYVRYPAGDLLDILALESWRARAYVVGEDLGTVEDGVREELARRAVLSYRLLWFEDAPPRDWPVDAMAAVTTHDLPTVAGAWTGADAGASSSFREKLAGAASLPDDAPVGDVVLRVHERLAEAPCRLVAATIDDALGVVERPNHPGTVTESNWSVALPVPLEEIGQDERVAHIGRTLHGR